MSKFKAGDRVICIRDSIHNPNVRRGVSFTIGGTYGSFHIYLDGTYGVHNENMFVIDDQPDVDQPAFCTKPDKCLEYLKEGVSEYVVNPPSFDDAYDNGYRDCLLDVLQDVYGISAVTRVEFVNL